MSADCAGPAQRPTDSYAPLARARYWYVQKRQEGSKGIRSESGVECEAKMSSEDYKQVLESMQASMDNDSGSNATPKPKKQKPDPVAKLTEELGCRGLRPPRDLQPLRCYLGPTCLRGLHLVPTLGCHSLAPDFRQARCRLRRLCWLRGCIHANPGGRRRGSSGMSAWSLGTPATTVRRQRRSSPIGWLRR